MWNYHKNGECLLDRDAGRVLPMGIDPHQARARAGPVSVGLRRWPQCIWDWIRCDWMHQSVICSWHAGLCVAGGPYIRTRPSGPQLGLQSRPSGAYRWRSVRETDTETETRPLTTERTNERTNRGVPECSPGLTRQRSLIETSTSPRPNILF